MAQPSIDPILDSSAAPNAPPPITGTETDSSKRIRQLTERFRYAWGHPKWTQWRKEAQEDEEFTAGVNQWDKADLQLMREKGRAALTINQIRPVVSVVIGYERQTRMDLKALPQGPEDLQDVTLLSQIMKKVMDDQDGGSVLSEGFKVGITGGLGCWYIGVDYTEDPVHGTITIEQLPRGEYVWDPDSRKYDLSDARDFFWYKTVSADILKAQYPDHADAIDKAITVLTSSEARAAGLDIAIEIPAHNPADPYRESLDPSLITFDPTRQEVLVLEAWYRSWETVRLLVNQQTNSVDEIPEDGVAVARALVQADTTESLKLITRSRRTVQQSVILPALQIELDHGQPFENDLADYPFVKFCAYEEAGEVFGLVRNLKDPQREVNKRRSAMVDNASQYGALHWTAERGSVENPEFFDGGAGAGNVLWTRSGKTAPVPHAPPNMPEWIWRLEQEAKADIRETSGVNAPLQGQAAAGDSGIKVARLQAQGQIITSELFDNYRRSRRLIGKRLAKRVQQTFTGEMTVRLQSDAGGTQFVTLNQKEVDAEGHQHVVRDIPNLTYDVTISDSPSTPTARAAAAELLLDLIGKFPNLAPALADILVEMTDIPNREQVLERVREVMARAGFGPQAQQVPGQPAMPTGAQPQIPPQAGGANGGGRVIRPPVRVTGEPTGAMAAARGIVP